MRKIYFIIAIMMFAMACTPALNVVSVYDFSTYKQVGIHIFPESLQPQRSYYTLGAVNVVMTSGRAMDTSASSLVDAINGTNIISVEMVEKEMIKVAKEKGADAIASYTCKVIDNGFRASGVLIKYE